MLADVAWNRRKLRGFTISLSIGLRLELDPKALECLPDTIRLLMTNGLLPAAAIAISLNLRLPEELAAASTEDVSGGLSDHRKGSLPGS